MEADTPEPLARILEQCWQLDSRKRPTAHELVGLVETAIQSVCGEGDCASARSAEGVSERDRQEARKHSRTGTFVAQSDARNQTQSAGQQVPPAGSALKGPSWAKGSDVDGGFVQKASTVARSDRHSSSQQRRGTKRENHVCR